MINVKIDSRVLKRKVDRVTKAVIVGIGTDVRTVARVYAATVAKWTLPYGAFTKRPKNAMIGVAGDIKRTQVMMDALGSVWNQMEAVDPDKANLLWAAMKRGKKTLQRKLTRELAELVGMNTGPLSPQVHQSARGGEKMTVPFSHKQRHIITQGSVNQRDAYIKQRQKAIGRAKAGWAAAAKALGGAVSKREGFQAWYNTGQHKQAKGSAKTKETETRIEITLYNRVPWSGIALTPASKRYADREVMRRIPAALEKKVKRKFKQAMT